MCDGFADGEREASEGHGDRAHRQSHSTVVHLEDEGRTEAPSHVTPPPGPSPLTATADLSDRAVDIDTRQRDSGRPLEASPGPTGLLSLSPGDSSGVPALRHSVPDTGPIRNRQQQSLSQFRFPEPGARGVRGRRPRADTGDASTPDLLRQPTVEADSPSTSSSAPQSHSVPSATALLDNEVMAGLRHQSGSSPSVRRSDNFTNCFREAMPKPQWNVCWFLL